jgi:K+ transporter
MKNNTAHTTGTAALTLAALGIVYGDIGTSPLYAVKETFNPSHGIPLIQETIIGGISAIFWALMIVVSLKYVVLIMRADNRGVGVMRCSQSALCAGRGWRGVALANAGMVSTALLHYVFPFAVAA